MRWIPGKKIASGLLIGLILPAWLALSGCSRSEVLYPKFVRDLYLSFAVQDGLRELTNTLLNGQPYGDVEIDGVCDGGTVRVTGSISQTPNLDVLDLDFELQNCRMGLMATGLLVDVVVDGTIHVDSSFDRFIDEGTESLTSEALAIDGESSYNDHMVHLSSECPFELTLVVNSISESLMGAWCDRPISLSLSHKD